MSDAIIIETRGKMDVVHRVLLVTGLLIFLALIWGIVSLLRKGSGTPNIPQICESPDCIGKNFSCDIMTPATITTCTMPGSEQDDPCYECFGNMTCQSVESGSYFLNVPNLPGGKCESPYVPVPDPTNPSQPKCAMPSGTYCMPYNPPDVPCNSYTGRKVLGKVSEHAPYEYLCLCVDDTAFTNGGNPRSDCDHIRVCSMDGVTSEDQVAACAGLPIDQCGLRFLVRSGSDLTPWTGGSNWNPYDGVCKCGRGEAQSAQSLTCVTDMCGAGSLVDPDARPGDPNYDKCRCALGFVDCVSLAAGRGDWVCKAPTCVPDPCGNGGQYNVNTGHCVCDATGGYLRVPSVTSAAGETCVNYCYGSSNPCGNRGDCVMNVSDEIDRTVTWKFIWIGTGEGCPAGNDGCWLVASTNVIGGHTGYLNIGAGSLQVSDQGTAWQLQIYCENGDDTCKTGAVATNQLAGQQRYYLVQTDGATFHNYVNLDPASGFAVVTDQAKAKYFQFYPSLIPGTDDYDLTQGQMMLVSSLLIQYKGGTALGAGTTVLNHATCTNCRAPNMQGPANLCEDQCLLDGTRESHLSNCCSCQTKCPSGCAWCSDSGDCMYQCDGGVAGEISKAPCK